jgi:hypothetical protein
MKQIKDILQHIAPTLASALGGPFSGTAMAFMSDRLFEEPIADEQSFAGRMKELLNNPGHMQKVKEIDRQFAQEMKQLNIDLRALEANDRQATASTVTRNNKPQVIISLVFLSVYFLMLSSIFYVEVSDTLNMRKGENSLMGELQILFGVLTAGVGQILSYWFGGVFVKK